MSLHEDFEILMHEIFPDAFVRVEQDGDGALATVELPNGVWRRFGITPHGWMWESRQHAVFIDRVLSAAERDSFYVTADKINIYDDVDIAEWCRSVFRRTTHR